MAKVITVFGNSGSGRSVFFCVLAHALVSDKNSKAIIINAEPGVPMIPVWLPEQIAESNMSIGQLLTADDLDTAMIANKVTLLKEQPNIGLLGYTAGETPLSYPSITIESSKRLIATVSKLVSYVIIDCGSNIANYFTPVAIESAAETVRILTPDLKGVNYLKSHQPMLLDPRFRFDEHLTFAGLARPFHALEEMGHVIGGWNGLLPYNKEIYRCAVEGGIFKAIDHCGQKYMASIKTVLEAVRGEQFE